MEYTSKEIRHMKTAHETLAEFIQQMKDYELYWGELTQKSLDEGTFFEIDEDENSKKMSDEIKKIHQQFLSKKALSLKRARQEAPSF